MDLAKWVRFTVLLELTFSIKIFSDKTIRNLNIQLSMEHMCEEQDANLVYLAEKSHTDVGQTCAVY